MAHYSCSKCGWSGEINGRPRCLPCYARATARWRKSHPEKALAQKARYDSRARATRRDWYNAKRRRLRKPETNTKARRIRLDWLLSGDVTREELITIYEKSEGHCTYCGRTVRARFTPFDPRGFDHVKSRAKGGKHTASNIVVCCRPCNERKG